MDKQIFMVLLFALLVCMSIFVLVACIWKLIKLFAKVKVEQQIEDLEALGEDTNKRCHNDNATAAAPNGTKISPTKNPYRFMSPNEARNLRRLSILAGFDKSRPFRKKSVSCSPCRPRRNDSHDRDCEIALSEDNSIKSSRTDVDGVEQYSAQSLGLFANLLTCGCCIPIHERLTSIFFQSSEERHHRHRRRYSSNLSHRNDGIISSKRNVSEIESTSISSQQFRYKQETLDEHLELIEKEDVKKPTISGKGLFKYIPYI